MEIVVLHFWNQGGLYLFSVSTAAAEDTHLRGETCIQIPPVLKAK